jgi:O-antigen ligase
VSRHAVTEPRAPTPEPASRRRAALLLLVLALAYGLPFEPIHPLLASGWLDLNHLKLLLLATAVVWVMGMKGGRELLRTSWPALVFLAVAACSALLAPADRGEALKFTGRLASGLYALALARHVVRSRRALDAVLWAIVLGAGTSAALGLGEAAGVRLLDPLLALFKVAPTRVGGDLRVSASFQYATIASMYFELAAPLALVLAATASRRWARALAALIAGLCCAVVVLTITRAGVVALALALAGLLVLAWARPRWRRLAAPTAFAGASMALVFVGLAARQAAFGTRLATENDWNWYAATYSAPDSLSLVADAPTDASIVARNVGAAVWTKDGDHPFALGYRWLSADATSQLDVASPMLDLPRDVAPGDAVQLTVPVTAHLPPGDYRVAWGMLQHDVLWFHDRGYPDAETLVHVAPGAAPTVAPPVGRGPRSDTAGAAAPVPRAALWGVALRMFAQRPLLGFGPDAFRHTYGTYLGLPSWDERIHANNLYLELLADVGVLGAAAFGLVVAPAILALGRGLRAPGPAVRAIWLAGLGASLATFFVHGALDYFLEFTPVYLLFWLVVGLSSAAVELEPC